MKKQYGLKNLMTNFGMTQEEIGKKIGKSRSAISNSMRILNLDPRVLEFAKEGKLSEGHCKALLPITDLEKQYSSISFGSKIKTSKTFEKIRFRTFQNPAPKSDRYLCRASKSGHKRDQGRA